MSFLTLSTTEFFTFLKAFESMSNIVSLGNSNFMALTALASYEWYRNKHFNQNTGIYITEGGSISIQ